MACKRPSKGAAALLTALLSFGGAGLSHVAWADPPTRVVSMNLCTDQLAMMLAAPGQLISVSDIAADPLTSPMADVAAAYPANYGGAEEIYLLNPDLVLAGQYSDPAVISMLRRLGVAVLQVDLVTRLDQVTDRLRQVGQALGQDPQAAEMAAAFDSDLAMLTRPQTGPRAGFYYPNGYSLGTATLSHEILTTAGFRHIADELGRDHSGRLALELLAIAAPDLVIRSGLYPGNSRSEEILHHPALLSLMAAGRGHISGPDWVCGTPAILLALADLSDTRSEMEAAE